MAHSHRLRPLRVVADDAVPVVIATPAGDGLRTALEAAGFAIAGEAATARDAVSAMIRAQASACVLDAALPGDRDWAIRAVRAALPDAAVVLFATGEAGDDEILAALNAGAAAYVTGAVAAPHAVRLALEGHAAVPLATVARLGRRAPWLHPETRPAADADLSPRQREVLEALLDGATTAEIAGALGLSAVTVRRHVSGAVHKLGGSSREALLGTPAPPADADATATLSDRELQVLRLAANGWSNHAIADELFITPSTVKNHLTRIMAKLGARNRTEAAVLAARSGQL